MLPAAHRLRHSHDFTAVTRRGARGSAGHVVVYVRSTGEPRGARAGFIVSKKVGNSVVRHRVTRQLRPIVRERLTTLPVGTDVVIRALPEAAGASSTVLATDLDMALSAAQRGGRRSRRKRNRG